MNKDKVSLLNNTEPAPAKAGIIHNAVEGLGNMLARREAASRINGTNIWGVKPDETVVGKLRAQMGKPVAEQLSTPSTMDDPAFGFAGTTIGKVGKALGAKSTDKTPRAYVYKVGSLDDFEQGFAGKSAAPKGLTPSEKQALDLYTSDASANEFLRTGKVTRDHPEDLATPVSVMKKQAAAIDSIFEKTPPIARQMELYRGIRDVDGKILSQFKRGSTFTDKSFLSASSDEEIAHGFAGTDFGVEDGMSPIVLWIKVPPGSKVLDINKALDDGRHAGVGNESEYLFPRGSSFTVDKIGKIPGGGHVIDVTLNVPKSK